MPSIAVTALVIVQKNLEITFKCKDDKIQLCSRQILAQSDFLFIKSTKTDKFDGSLDFDYTEFSHDAVKLFLDSMHLIEPNQVNLSVVLECIDLAHSEGKTDWDSFEKRLSAELVETVQSHTLPICTELLISAFLKRVDNFDNKYEKRVVRKLNKHTVRSFLIKLSLI